MKKAQIHFDYMVGFFIFLTVIFIAAFITFRPIIQNTEYTNEKSMEETSHRLSELLIKTGGLPVNWENNPDTIKRVGLASEPWVLDYDKVDSLDSLNYSQIKESFDLTEHNFFLKVYSEDITRTVGNLPPNTQSVSIVNRYAVLENKTARITIGIW